MWQVTRDRWHMTGDRWHVTHDTWHMTHSVGWTFSQNFSSLALPVWVYWCFEDLEENHHLLTLAPATPGLLKTLKVWQPISAYPPPPTPVSVALEEYYRINVVVWCWQSGESCYPIKSACLTTLQSIQTDFLNMICYGGTKIQSKNVV